MSPPVPAVHLTQTPQIQTDSRHSDDIARTLNSPCCSSEPSLAQEAGAWAQQGERGGDSRQRAGFSALESPASLGRAAQGGSVLPERCQQSVFPD